MGVVLHHGISSDHVDVYVDDVCDKLDDHDLDHDLVDLDTPIDLQDYVDNNHCDKVGRVPWWKPADPTNCKTDDNLN